MPAEGVNMEKKQAQMNCAVEELPVKLSNPYICSYTDAGSLEISLFYHRRNSDTKNNE